jgi:hypothetical protein
MEPNKSERSLELLDAWIAGGQLTAQEPPSLEPGVGP